MFAIFNVPRFVHNPRLCCYALKLNCRRLCIREVLQGGLNIGGFSKGFKCAAGGGVIPPTVIGQTLKA